MMATLINRRKMPKVRMVIGMVSSTKIGFTNVLSSAKTIATKMALKKLLTSIPGIRNAQSITTNALIIKLISNLILIFYLILNDRFYNQLVKLVNILSISILVKFPEIWILPPGISV